MSAFDFSRWRFDIHAHLEDATLFDLWEQAWQATFPALDFRARRAWFETHVADLCTDGAQLLCAYDDKAPAGFALFHPRTNYMDQLVVAPTYFGSGLALVLLNEVRRCVAGALALDVNQDNLRACRFYLRVGFEIKAEGRNARSGLATYSLRDRIIHQA